MSILLSHHLLLRPLFIRLSHPLPVTHSGIAYQSGHFVASTLLHAFCLEPYSTRGHRATGEGAVLRGHNVPFRTIRTAVKMVVISYCYYILFVFFLYIYVTPSMKISFYKQYVIYLYIYIYIICNWLFYICNRLSLNNVFIMPFM